MVIKLYNKNKKALWQYLRPLGVLRLLEHTLLSANGFLQNLIVRITIFQVKVEQKSKQKDFFGKTLKNLLALTRMTLEATILTFRIPNSFLPTNNYKGHQLFKQALP